MAQKIYPAKKAKFLDSAIRRWIQDPRKIIGSLIKPGDLIIDLGCGPGYFTIDMIKMIKEDGFVIAVDLQQEMLDFVGKKAEEHKVRSKIHLHCCERDSIGLDNLNADFILGFYMIHEVEDKVKLFYEIYNLLKDDGKFFMVEPIFHVSKDGFDKSLKIAKTCGLEVTERRNLFMSQGAILQKKS